MRFALSFVVLAIVALGGVASTGCQSCLGEEGNQPKEQQPPPASSTRPIAEGPAKMRPKLIAPKIEFRDASEDD